VKSKVESRKSEVAGLKRRKSRFYFRLSPSDFRLAVGCCVLALVASTAPAQQYPTKPVRIIVPAAPSGGLDIMARVVGQPLAGLWGQPVVVENRPGAGVMLGTELVSKSVPDGYTLLMINANLAPNAVLHDKLSVVKNLAAVIKIADLPNALAVPAASPATSMKDLAGLIKTTKMTYSSAGHGTVGNILAEMLKLSVGAPNLVHVPYKGGNPAMTALVGGEVSMGIVSLASTMAYAKSGRVKILAVSSSQRSRLAPDIPTIGETVKGVELESWVGLLAPAGTPAPVIRAINAAVLKAIAMPDTRERLVAQGYDVLGGSPEEFARLIQSDVKTYSRVIKEARITLD
jgi:tripartite-type tricarboxylate transporter receptor subunit TctC